MVAQISQKLKDNPSLISDLERQGWLEDGAFDGMASFSSPPTEPLSSSGDPWFWESIRYPSMIGVLNLSRQFSEVTMRLCYDDDDDFISTYVYIKNAQIIDKLEFELSAT